LPIVCLKCSGKKKKKKDEVIEPLVLSPSPAFLTTVPAPSALLNRSLSPSSGTAHSVPESPLLQAEATPTKATQIRRIESEIEQIVEPSTFTSTSLSVNDEKSKFADLPAFTHVKTPKVYFRWDEEKDFYLLTECK